MTPLRPALRSSWLGNSPTRWAILEPRRLFHLRRQAERPEDVHLTPSQRFGVLPQEKYMEITGNRVVLNLSGTRMQHVEAGDFISHLRTFQGGLELARTAGKVSPAYTVIAPRPGVEPEFFKYVLKSQGYVSQIASLTDQLRDGQTMRFAEFNKTALPVPPQGEQRAIADYLDHETAEIDAFIRDVDTLSSLAMERRAVFLEHSLVLGTGKTLPLRRLSPLQISGVSVNAAPWASCPGELGVLKTGAVSKGWFDPTENKAVLEASERARLQTPVVGDRVLVNRANTPSLVGSAVYVREAHSNLYLSDKLWSLDFAANNDFMALALSTRHYREQVKQLAVGASSSMQNLSYGDFLTLTVQVPSKSEQARIVQKFTSQSRNDTALVTQAQDAKFLATERRAALISAVVTGQIDVAQRHRPVAEQLEEEAFKKA